MSELKMRRPTRWRRKGAYRGDVGRMFLQWLETERWSGDKKTSKAVEVTCPAGSATGRLKSGYAVTFRALLEGAVEVVTAAPSWANSC
jgi:hypothetical protein